MKGRGCLWPWPLAPALSDIRYRPSSSQRTIPCDGSIGSSVLLVHVENSNARWQRWQLCRRHRHGGSGRSETVVREGRRPCGGWHYSKMAIGSSFHVKITKITNCMRSQITNRGSQNFCERQFVISERTENGTNSRFFVAKAPHLSLLQGQTS